MQPVQSEDRYIVCDSTGPVLGTGNAGRVTTFLWGRDLRRYAIFKNGILVRFTQRMAADIQAELEAFQEDDAHAYFR